jgi:hypothetical protein
MVSEADLGGDLFLDLDLDMDLPPDLTPEPRSTSENLSSEAEQEQPAPTRVRRRPIPRKGHTKSRNGCYNCKRRKVKCQENLPECYHCKRIGLVCEYPPPKNLDRNPAPRNALSVTPTTFSMEDMRFFQHFLLSAYPPLPIGGLEVWQGVARMSHHVSLRRSPESWTATRWCQYYPPSSIFPDPVHVAWTLTRVQILKYDFLIHAMLGLGASHLTIHACGDYSSHALTHRVQAIKSLNSVLSRPNLSQEDGDAAFATIMSLTFQSSYMPEGMFDFVSMVRGCQCSNSLPEFCKNSSTRNLG